MKTALDSSVILDVLTEDAQWADASEIALKKAQSLGQLIIGECVLAEITPALPEDELGRLLSDWKILFLPSTRESATMAGQMYRAYLHRNHENYC